jgi:hypothetical protein
MNLDRSEGKRLKACRSCEWVEIFSVCCVSHIFALNEEFVEYSARSSCWLVSQGSITCIMQIPRQKFVIHIKCFKIFAIILLFHVKVIDKNVENSQRGKCPVEFCHLHFLVDFSV